MPIAKPRGADGLVLEERVDAGNPILPDREDRLAAAKGGVLGTVLEMTLQAATSRAWRWHISQWCALRRASDSNE